VREVCGSEVTQQRDIERQRVRAAGVHFSVTAPLVEFRVTRWAGDVILWADEFADAPGMGLKFNLTPQQAMRLGRLMYQQGKAMAEEHEKSNPASGSDTASADAARDSADPARA
jgi:hypothetical protein